MLIRTGVTAIALAFATSAFAITFTEDFENPNWMNAPEWSYHGSPNQALLTQGGPVQFSPNDARLGSNVGANLTNYGGVSVTNATGITEIPDAPTQAVLDYTVQVQPNTTYYFSIDFESMVYDNNTQSSASSGQWRNGMQFHLGNSAAMATNGWEDFSNTNGGAIGPWSGDGGDSAHKRVGTQFHAIWGKSWDDFAINPGQNWFEHDIGTHGSQDFRGVWHNAAGSGFPTTFTTRSDRDNLGNGVLSAYDPSVYDGNRVTNTVTSGPDGLIIFRTGFRVKGQTVTQVSFALDNLTLELTQVPEPASLSLLALGGLMMLRRRRRVA